MASTTCAALQVHPCGGSQGRRSSRRVGLGIPPRRRRAHRAPRPPRSRGREPPPAPATRRRAAPPSASPPTLARPALLGRGPTLGNRLAPAVGRQYLARTVRQREDGSAMLVR